LEGFAESIMTLPGIDIQVLSYTQFCRQQSTLQVPLSIRQVLRSPAPNTPAAALPICTTP
jgi:hypothetical protein